jgi:hypothetical protein
MFDRETRRAKILEARGRARRDHRGKSAHGEVKFDSNLIIYLSNNLKKTEKTTTDGGPAEESELKEGDPVEKAEKDFWKIIEEEKRKRDRKTVLVSKIFPRHTSFRFILFSGR